MKYVTYKGYRIPDPGIPVERICKTTEGKWSEERALACANDEEADPKVLRYIYEKYGGNWEIMADLAENPKAPDDIICKLIVHPNELVRIHAEAVEYERGLKCPRPPIPIWRRILW